MHQSYLIVPLPSLSSRLSTSSFSCSSLKKNPISARGDVVSGGVGTARQGARGRTVAKSCELARVDFTATVYVILPKHLTGVVHHPAIGVGRDRHHARVFFHPSGRVAGRHV